MNAQPLIVGLGEILWDLLPSGKQLGGAPANFAYHAQALGGESLVVSAVGKDELGREILGRLDALALNAMHVAVDGCHPTGTVTVALDRAGTPAYTIHEHVAWDFIPQAPQLLALAAETDAVCFGSLAQRSPVSRATIHAFLRATPAAALRIFDINLRQSFYSREVIDASLRLSNVLKLNHEELPRAAQLLAIAGDEMDVLRELSARYGLRLVALTRGARGSILYTQEGVSGHAGFPAEVVDTVGAGDAFAAALALGLLRGHDLERINADANRVAAYVCSQPGATPLLPCR